MTKKLLFLHLGLTLLLAFPLCASAQSAHSFLRAIYRLEFKPDSTVANLKSVQMILRVNDGASCFSGSFSHAHDSVYASLAYLPEAQRIKIANDASTKTGRPQFFYTVFKEPAKNLVFYHDDIGSIDHQYQENHPLFHWILTPARQTVAGYECQQAYTRFGGRMWEAWFTRQIPLSEGPYKFYGLPGLIVSIRDTHRNYAFELVNLDTHPKPFTIVATSSAPLVKKSKFEKAKYNDELTFLDRMASNGNQIPESLRQNHVQMMKRRNNPLERK